MQRKNFAIIFFASHLAALIFSLQMFFATPYLLKQLNSVTYATWLSISEVAVFFMYFDFGISTNVVNKISYSFINKDIKKVYQYFLISFWFTVATIPIFLICSLFVLNLYLRNNNIPLLELNQFKDNFFLIALASYFSCLTQPFNALFNGIQNIKQITFYFIFSTLIAFIFCILLLINEQKLYAIGTSYIIRSSLILLGTFFCIYMFIKKNRNVLQEKSLFIPSNLSLFKEITKNLFDSLIISMSNNLLTRIDLILLTWFMSPKKIICYSITKRLLEICRVVSDAFILAIIAPYTNKYYSSNKDKIRSIIIEIIVTFYFISYFTGSIYPFLNEFFILIWLKNISYLLDYKITFLMTLNIFIGFLSLLLSRLIFSSDYSKRASKSIILETGLKLALGAVGLIAFNIIGMLIFFISVSAYMVIKNIKFINENVLNNNDASFKKIIINSLFFFVCILCTNSIVFEILKKHLQYSILLFIFQVGILIWYYPYLNFKKILLNKLQIISGKF